MVVEDLPLPLVVAEGGPAEIGARYGHAARDLIGGNLDEYLRRFRDFAGLDGAAVRAAGGDFRATTVEYAPRIAAMLDALADGAGVPAADVYALNARTELLLPASPGDGECTSLAVLPSHTASGHTLLAQNWDWHPEQQPYTLLLATRDERGHTVVTLTEAGMLAKAGLTGAGVGVCVNLLGSDRDGKAGGVPYHVLIRAVLDARDAGHALRVAALPRSASINLLIAVAGGIAVDLELVPGDLGRVAPHDGLLVHSNHLLSAVPVHDRIADTGGSSLYRDLRARQLLSDAVRERRVTEADVRAVLTDHVGAPYGICRHLDLSEPPADRALSAYSVVMDLDQRRLAVAAGPPCEHSYVDVPLAAVFA